MSQEIELKMIFPSTQATEIAGLVELITKQKASQKTLTNSYFDTPDLQLRQWDMGLRIRRVGTFAEQTLKCAAQSDGGLHARAEYNCEISGSHPQLSAFPAEVWPKGCVVAALEARLSPLFSTDFERQAWQLSWQGAEIEIALDLGAITGRKGTCAIHELELELLNGKVEALFNLAETLVEGAPLRLWRETKAARGYRLAGLTPDLTLPALVRSEGNGLELAQEALLHYQNCECCYLAGVADAGAALSAALENLAQICGQEPRLQTFTAPFTNAATALHQGLITSTEQWLEQSALNLALLRLLKALYGTSPI